PGHHGHVGVLRRVRAAPEAQGSVRRGRCRLGAALRLPHGSRLQAPSLLDEGKELARLPSEYFRDNISLTFQDDWTAFQFADRLGPNQLMWANDFPHSDSTWPWSQDVIKEQTGHLDPVLRKRILRDNVAELYKLAA